MDFSVGKDRSRKKYSIFASFIMCCLGTSFMISSLATQYWFQSGLIEKLDDQEKGDVHFGLFSGQKNFNGLSPASYDIKIVCLDGDCIYSCGRTKDLRKDELKSIKNNDTDTEFDLASSCDNLYSTSSNSPREVSKTVIRGISPLQSSSQLFRRVFSALKPPSIISPLNGGGDDLANEKSDSDQYYVLGDEDPEVETEDPEFMSYGLWVGTISCLVIGMVFAVVGALFAVINTATTPVEFITGVPGLYIWNSMAALFNLLCVILWAVQFHQHLTKNVLYNTDKGWTTEGREVFGYSFWLVVVAIIVHVANIAIIFVGTYERKVKEQIQKPEEKSTNLMLY